MSFNGPFTIIGHRGAAGLAPENTLASFKLALDLGVDAVELDVYRVNQNLVVLHDDTLERTTNGHGRIENSLLPELRALDAGDGEQIPLLQEVFSLLPPEVAINVELKGVLTAEPLYRLLAEFPHHDVLVSSFNFPELSRFREIDKVTRVAPIFYKPHDDMLKIAKRLSAWSIHLPRRMISRELVQRIHQANFKVLVWTVNDVAQGQAFREMGVEGIFTDFPDRFTDAAKG